MNYFLKYLAVRFFWGTFAAMFVVYWLLIWVHEVLYAGRPFDDRYLILFSYLVTLLAVSALISLWGRWNFSRLLELETRKIGEQYHPETLIAAYDRLLNYLESSYFFNITRARLARAVARRLGRILLGLRVEDDEALMIYEKILLAKPEEKTFYGFLIWACSRKRRVSERSFNFLRRRYHERPDDKLVGILAREYTLRRILTFESERVLERCIKVYPEYKEKILAFVIPSLISYQRTDDNAARFYLDSMGTPWRNKVAPILRQIYERYREKGREDELALRVLKAIRQEESGQEEFRKGEAAIKSPATDSSNPDELYGNIFFDGLAYEEEEESAGEKKEGGAGEGRMGLESRIYALAQRFFSVGRPSLAFSGRIVRAALLIVLLAVFTWLAWPIAEHAFNSFRASKKPGESSLQSEPSGFPLFFGDKYTIQVGAFSDSSRAASLSDLLSRHGEASRVISSESRGRRVFKVCVGLFSSESAAESKARTLAASRLIQEWQIMPYDKAIK